MDTITPQSLSHTLMTWYSSHWRELPWRQNPTAYRVWISEIMLQQTRIEAVLPYFSRFMAALPDVESLATVSEDKLLKLWEGLGYYSRAKNLQKAAKRIVCEYGGHLPADYDKLLALPGIGPYTAGAIASIAFSIPVPAVDGNVMRVLARLTGDATDVLSTAGKKRFTDLAWELVPEEEPGRFNQAIMELGETVCLPNTMPRCEACPWVAYCVANRQSTQTTLPVRSKKKPRRIEKRHVAVLITDESPARVVLHRRGDTGLLSGLWELPNTLTAEDDELLTTLKNACKPVEDLPTAKHIFSHVEWHMTATHYRLPSHVPLPPDYTLATLDELQTHFALPSAFRAYLSVLPQLLKGE